jgi:hypothetical protein
MKNSVGMIGFTLLHEDDEPTPEEIRKSLFRRIADLEETNEWTQAISFDDTIDSEN